MKSSFVPFLFLAAASATSTIACEESQDGQVAVPEAEATGDVPPQPVAHPFGANNRTATYVIHSPTDMRETDTDTAPATLCRQGFFADGGAGLFRVDSVTSVAESDSSDPDGPVSPFVYYELTLVSDWSGIAPNTAVLRTEGGWIDEENWRSVDVLLEEGETVGLLMLNPDPENAGFYKTYNGWVYRADSDGLYSSEGNRFGLGADDLGDRLRQVYEALPDVDHPNLIDGCEAAVPWDLCPPASLLPENAPRNTPPHCNAEPDVAPDTRPRSTETDAGM